MSAATSKADNLVLSNGKTSQQLIMGKANTFKAKAGEHYRILKHQEGVAEQLVDDLIAKRSGNDLQLHYADGTEVNLENYFTECAGASCDMTLPGDHGSEFKLSGDSATGAALGDGSHLVYVHGSHDVVLDMAQSNSALLSTLSGNNGAEITYIPPADHDAVAWAGGAALLLGGVALASSSGGSNDAAPPPPPAHNIVTVSVVAGPVIETNGLTVNLYKADGTTLLGSGKLSATGTFTFDVGSYTGVVIAKVQDNDSGPSMADYIDEATGQARDLTANLMTVGVVNTGVVNLNINVLTTIAATKAGAVFDGVGAKPVTADVVVQTNTAVANAFGLADLTGSPVVTTVNTSGTANTSFTPDSLSVAEKYGAVLAAFSGMDTTNGGNMQTAIDSVTAGLNVTGSTAVLNTTVLDSLVVGARAAAVNTNGTGETSLSAVISDLTVKTSSSVSINRVATDDVVAINEPNSVISGTNAAGATVILSIGGQNQTAVVTGTTWTYTLTASDITAMGQGGETITATATLTSGATATATRSIVVDTVPPTVQISSNDTQLTAGEAATLTFTLSDAAKDFAASDIVVTGGVLSNFTGSGKIYTATFTPTPNSSVPATINVAGNSFTSSSGNLNLPATELTLSVDTTVNAVPVITSGATASVAENTATSAVVYTATATDADAGSVLRYSLSGTDAAAFNINSATGAVTFIAPANFETKSSYSFNVIASDGKASSTPQAVTLTVNNLDEVAPSITSSAAAAAINENSGAGQLIYTATSTDVADASTGATVYSLKAGTGDVALLSINSSTGAVTLAGNPNFEVKANYSFTVVATDAAGNASEKAVTLAVNNLDEVAPTITSSATATAVNENIGAGQVIYTATSTDVADIATGATVYSLKAATGDVALLSINSSTGAVTLTGNPNFEVKANYSFTVVATDAAGNASEKAVTLAVNNLDEVAPGITSGATATAINENSGAGQLIYTATSTDVADIVTGATVYSLKAATGDVALLSINSSTGAVTLTGNPDFETKANYSFTVVATDAAGNASEKAVTLAVNNLDEVAPSITSSAAAAAINENSGAGQVIYTATSTDVADIATGVTVYSLKAATGDVALLSINSSTGAVTLTGNPDFETKANYSFTVVATDAAGNASEKAVTLAVNNLDEVAPSITSSAAAAAINENSGAGQVIYTATSTDVADIATGATVYSLKAATGDVALLSINSSTGAVTLTGNPDFETKANYSFTVVATDAAGNASEKAVTLAVNNLDEVAPSITSSATATAVNENSGAGQVIYTATSTDVADIATGSTVYSLKAATGDVALLSINSSTGAVTLTGNPDFETKANYSFTVVATDAAGNASEKAVTLAINDLVDETPPQVGSVAVSSASGVQNSTLNAGDVVSVTVTMDEATVVNTAGGTPRIALNIGGTTVYASYASGSGTTALVFQYTVQAGQTDVNGISIDANGLSANGGTLRDAAGNAATLTHIAAADNAGFLVDTTAPTANFTSATDDVGSVTGTLISGARTDDTSLVLAGTCEAGSMVNVYNGTTLLGAATVSGTSWSYSAAVVNGTTYQFNVKESDSAGNTSAATSYFTVTGDTLAPTANLTSATDDVGSVTGALVSGARTDDTSLALAGTCEAGSTVNIYNGATLLGAATVSGTSWSYNAAITDGTTYQFNAKETDIAGNTSAATSNFTVIGDTTPPTANLTSATDDIGSVTGALISGARTDDTSLALTGTCEAGSTVNIYNGATLLGSATVSGTSWSYSAAITDGTTYQFNAKETDSVGNTSAATSNFTVIGDTTPPTAHFTSATDDAGSLTGTLINGARTDDTSLTLTGTCEAGSTVNVYDGATLLGAATVSGTSWSYTATLVNGTTYQFNEKETDAAGNTSVATSNFAVTGDTAVTAHLTSVTDNVGSITGAMASGGRTDDSSLVLAGTCEAGSIVYIYDGASLIGAGTVTGTSWTYTASIADGTSYLFNVTENDVAGNHSAHTSNFAVTGDTNAPVLTGSSPLDNAIGVAVNSNIVLTFNENVLAGSGNIVISNGGADVRTISIADSSQVSISGGVVTINPTADLAGGTHYDVTMSAGVITDTAGNSFTGIAQDTRDFNTAAALDSSIVVFDLVQGVSSAHSSRTFAAGVDYTIYIRVSSGNAPLAHSGAHGDTWGQWSGANNLDANDKVVLVGSGQSVYIASGQAVNARGQGSGPGTIQWGRLGGLSSWAANLTNTGLFRRNFSGNPVGGATMSNGLYLWHAGGGGNNGPWANINGFPGKATGALWLNALPANVLTTQGLAT